MRGLKLNKSIDLSDLRDDFLDPTSGLDNVLKMFNPVANLEDTKTYKIITEYSPSLPAIRTEGHDTINFLILMNAKSEFVYNASLINPFNTEHFAWIDFNIFHVINNIEHATSKLKLFGFNKLINIVPGVFSQFFGLYFNLEIANCDLQ